MGKQLVIWVWKWYCFPGYIWYNEVLLIQNTLEIYHYIRRSHDENEKISQNRLAGLC